MSDYYLLVDGEPVQTDLMTWAKSFETNDRHLEDTEIDGVRVSTVFRGFDLGFGKGPPLIFETLVFDGPLDGEINRYATREEAEAGHADMVRRVKESTT